MNRFDQFLESVQDQAYALLRIVAGFLFIWHGSQKLFNFPLDFPFPLGPLIYSAAAIELIGGVLVMIGFLTRPVAFLCSGTMAFAYWYAHGINGFFPIVNHGEISALYCFIFLFVASKGAGIWSIESAMKR